MPLSVELHQRFKEQADWTLDARKLFLQASGIIPGCKILEAGCGTGAILSSLQSLIKASYFGIDIKPEMVRFAHSVVPDSFLTAADAYRIPFPASSFDVVVCHYLLLWVQNPEALLMEFMRVTRPGGFIAFFAEPDYGSRIDYPSELEKTGKLQREALIQQGADPDIGRRLRAILANSGCESISSGILGSFQTETDETDGISEQLILQKDLSGLMKSGEIKCLLDLDIKARKDQSRVQYIPTFFGWGRKPNLQKTKSLT
jgi:SAM-dependent methyltransferase